MHQYQSMLGLHFIVIYSYLHKTGQFSSTMIPKENNVNHVLISLDESPIILRWSRPIGLYIKRPFKIMLDIIGLYSLIDYIGMKSKSPI